MNSHVNNILYHTRRLATDYDDGCHSDSKSEVPSTPRAGSLTPCRGDDSDTEHTPQPQLTPEFPSTPVSNSRKRPASSSSDDEGFSNPFPEPPPRGRPSDYLRSRCPLCFGGNFPRCPDSKGYVEDTIFRFYRVLTIRFNLVLTSFFAWTHVLSKSAMQERRIPPVNIPRPYLYRKILP